MSATSVDRRRALVVGPAFFGYEEDIVRELLNQGYDTEFLDERPSNSSWTRAVLRVRKSLMARKVNAHFTRASTRISTQYYDLVIVIKGEVVPRWFLESLRNRNPTARFVFYTYDALVNSPNCIEILDCFDALLSFDRDDVERDGRFSYLPLFYTPEFAGGESPHQNSSRRYLLSFVGTLHSERYNFVKKLFAGQPRTFAFFFVQAAWYFAVVKYVTRGHRRVEWREVSFTPMSRRDIAETFRDSVAVLDMQRAGQSGLTMRTFEVIASGAILVTTNTAITREPFYDPSRIIVVPSDISDIDPQSVQAQLTRCPHLRGMPDGFEAYSLRAWVKALIQH